MPVTLVLNKKPRFIHLQDDEDTIGEDTVGEVNPRDILIKKIKDSVIEHVPLETLTPNPRAHKKHTDRKINLLSQGMQEFSFTQPIVVDERGEILCGHARYLAACRLKLSTVPIVRVLNLTPAKKRALALADNKLAELGEYDLEILAEELEFLSDPTVDLGFDMAITGFETVEIDNILQERDSLKRTAKDDRFDMPAPDAVPVSTPGDLWIADQHRLLCGDALIEASYTHLLGNERAQLCFADVPYNVRNKGHVTSRPNVREFAMAAGEMSSAEYTTFLHNSFRNIFDNIDPGGVAFVCIDWRHNGEMRSAGDPLFGEPKNLVVWVKSNAGNGSFYRPQHELINVYARPGARPINNFGLGAKGRYRTNVWHYPGYNSFGRDRDEILSMHPTVKPVALVMDALKDCSHRDGIVLDPFAGSGTTMIAAERTGRRARLIEFDPTYCDVIIQRWQKATGKLARLSETNETFDQVRVRRSPGSAANIRGGSHVK